ncbi:hypothetical protein J0A68_20600 [Algoriphagus sp. H41]|uniref:Cytochrome c domain-containing protein n=1 Tax=Algoriphagus oliviformis TaxID=2811231 RepID=A0ABS3C8D8_9BACT|nr:c-type cytochrome domain-containing protein [Algoriphagus oliviformis]MBN7813367.1 hypothetical protein [Algoriphagus oliviformis]
MENLDLFIGRFHPLLVHLPIGFLMLAFLMWAYQVWAKNQDYRQAIVFALLLGALSATAACVAGFLLASSGEYDTEMVAQHQWAGILTTTMAGCGYAAFAMRNRMAVHSRLAGGMLCAMILGLGMTGHLGGNLTHGSDYLTAYAPFGKKESLPPAPESIQETQLFPHVIRPILEQKCVSCHRQGKLKGGLSLESPESILRGGESGPVVSSPGKENELIRRIHLKESDEEVMPPKGKKQLTKEEMALLEAWISSGGDFSKPMTAYADSVSGLATGYLGLVPSGETEDLKVVLAPVRPGVLEELRGKGVLIRELLDGSYSYDVHIPAAALRVERLEDLLLSLEPIRQNVLWLDLSGLGMRDTDLAGLPAMPNLLKLRLERNHLTDRGLSFSGKFPGLQVLNLYGNEVTDHCLEELGKLGKLRRVYVWQTRITQTQVGEIRLIGEG